MSSKIQISIIDDDEQSRDALAGLMQAMGFTIETFASAVDFLASANVRHTSCLIVDVQMPRMTGTELHSRLVGSGYDILTILITAYSDDSASSGSGSGRRWLPDQTDRRGDSARIRQIGSAARQIG